MKIYNWLLSRDMFFWIGMSGILITGIIHGIIFYYNRTHITERFNFYLVWLIFLIISVLKKRLS